MVRLENVFKLCKAMFNTKLLIASFEIQINIVSALKRKHSVISNSNIFVWFGFVAVSIKNYNISLVNNPEIKSSIARAQ